MNYNEAIEYIHSVSNYFCKPGLERISKLCAFLKNPQDSLKFIHVAGTNGKGSFCAMLSEILVNAGYKVGLYTSPYILEFNERIKINSDMIKNNELAELCEYVKSYSDKLKDKPTEFELITAIAFEYFKREKCDIVILECGLGGKFDATNVVKPPVLSVITGIDIDHQNFLGNTITDIAHEKAGIIKENSPVLWCGDNEEAKNVIINKADSVKSVLYTPTEKDSVKIIKRDFISTVFDYKNYKNLELNLLGEYQVTNAVNVISACEILNKKGFNISDKNIRNALSSVKWRARFEVLCKKPFIVFDGAHNKQGVVAAVESIKKYFNNKVNILTGVMADKDYVFIAKEISKVAKNVFCISPNNSRALSAEEYAEVFKKLNINSKHFSSAEEAIKMAAEDEKTPLVCLGSLYMYEEVYNSIKM